MPITQRTIFNTIVNEAGQPLAGVPVKAYLVTHQFVKGQSVEVIRVSVSAVSNDAGYWELSLVPNDTMEDPNSFYIIEEGMPTDKYHHRHYVRIPSGTGALPLEQARISPPFTLPSIPPEGLVSGVLVAGQQPLKGQVTFSAGEGIALTQDNTTKTITIAQVARTVWQKIAVLLNGTLYGIRSKINFITGSNVSISVTDDAANDAVNVTISALGGGGGGGAHNLLSDAHTDTQPTVVQRGMLIVGQLIGTGIKWAGLALGAAGKFLKSNGTDVVWGDVDWTEVKNTPATFPPSAHTHVKADITDFAHTHPPSQISPQGSGSGLDADTVDGQHASDFAPASHTHTRSQITDFAHASTHVAGGSDPLTGNLDANARVTVKHGGTVVGTRRAINFIAGSDIILSISDDAANEEVDVTISAAGSGSSSHNLLDGVVHPDTEATTVQRGMLIVGKLSGAVVKWGGLPLGAAGSFLKSSGTDAVWDVIQASDLPSHTHTKSQITDLETITTTPTDNAVPKANSSGKIDLGWIPQGSGSNLDADKLDGLDSTAFEKVANKGVANGYAPLDANAKLPTTHLPSHASTHVTGGSDPIIGNLDANARVGVQSSGTLIGTRRAINFIAGTNVSLNIADDATNERVNVTINASNSAGVGLDVYPKVLTPGSGWDDTIVAASWEIVTYSNTKQEVLRYRDDTYEQRWWEIVVLDAANFAGSFKIVWSSPVAAPAGGDAVVWEVSAGVINANGSVNPTLTTATAIATRAANEAANIQKETTVTLALTGVQNGSRIIIRVRRLGISVNDTLAGDVRLHKVVID
jgi:hypothetical protein